MSYCASKGPSEEAIWAEIEQHMAKLYSTPASYYTPEEINELIPKIRNLSLWPAASGPGKILNEPLFVPQYAPLLANAKCKAHVKLPPVSQYDGKDDIFANLKDLDANNALPVDAYEYLANASSPPRETYVDDMSNSGSDNTLILDSIPTRKRIKLSRLASRLSEDLSDTELSLSLSAKEELAKHPVIDLTFDSDLSSTSEGAEYIDDGLFPDAYGTTFPSVSQHSYETMFKKWAWKQEEGKDVINPAFTLDDDTIKAKDNKTQGDRDEPSFEIDIQNQREADETTRQILAEKKEKESKQRAKLIAKHKNALANNPSLKPSQNQKRAAAQKNKNKHRKPLTAAKKDRPTSSPPSPESKSKNPEQTAERLEVNEVTDSDGENIIYVHSKNNDAVEQMRTIMQLLDSKADDEYTHERLMQGMSAVKELDRKLEWASEEIAQRNGAILGEAFEETANEEGVKKAVVKGQGKKARNKAKKDGRMGAAK